MVCAGHPASMRAGASSAGNVVAFSRRSARTLRTPLAVCRLSVAGAAGLLVVGPTRLLGLRLAPLCSVASMSLAQLAGRAAHERRTTHAPALHADLTSAGRC